jgi:hypothetical protein
VEKADFTAETKTGRARLPQPVTLRFHPGLRDRVHERKAREGKSFTEMVNLLVERGLDADRPLVDAFGSPAGFAAAKALINAAEATAGPDWLRDEAAYRRATEAIRQTLAVLRPGETRAALALIERDHG